MALRSFYFVLALTMLIASGCKSSSNYQRPPAVVATPVPPPCQAAPIPPPNGVLVPAPR